MKTLRYPSKLDSAGSGRLQPDSSVPEIKPKDMTVSRKATTAPENLDNEALKTATESLSKTSITSLDSSVPESASVLDIINLKYRKLGSFNVKTEDDKKECWITGIVVTKSGNVILADNLNEKLKVFSKQMKFLSGLALPGEPWDVCLSGDAEAVISMPENEQLLIVDISGSKTRIKQTLELEYRVYGVAACQDSIIVACPYTTPPSVKRLDKKGRVKWSVDSYESHQLFTRPWYLLVAMATSTTSSKSRVSTIIVTDCDFHLENPRLVLLDASKGEVIGFRSMQSRNPYGIAADQSKSDFIYVCNSANEVAIMTKDLTEEKVILTEKEGIIGTPQALTFDPIQRSLIMSYSNKTRSYLDCFKLK